ncbi:tRNA modification GTPase MnmE [Planctomycetes bacterium Poly30]|uniref:tRNA modification GTPase MnmE n=2 Tax=Saltatorellus ferox TaxID=2528018 RepID=A0A518EWA1_9BACT|nr:tRNA modification GTPase MnmE [Planctomycetes bacterium Poly30]
MTPAGSAGVAVLLVTGRAAVQRLREAFSRELPRRGEIAYGLLQGLASAAEVAAEVPAEVYDEVLVVRAAPADHAAEDEAFEVHVHGSPFLVAEIARRLDPASGPLRASSGGGSNKADFRERALALVPGAPSVLGARVLLDQAGGAMDRALQDLRAKSPAERRATLAELARRGRGLERLFRETTVAIVGPVNAGKSTLFNVLVGADAASVSSEAGTTRDALSERARLGPWPVRFLDTAGERDLSLAAAAGDARALVEQEGQRIGADLSSRADLVLRLVSALDAVELPEPRAGVVVLLTQAARSHGLDSSAWPAGAVSALEDPDHARRTVEGSFCEALGLDRSGPLWTAGEAVPFDRRSIEILDSAAGLSEVTDTVLDELARSL